MQNPPADMGPHYQGGYDPIPQTLTELRAIAAKEDYRIAPILKHKTSGRYLEIGPWRGVACCGMKDAGFEVTALEMSYPCVNFLRDTVGIAAIQSSDPAETMKNLEPGFDVIAAWHSMEHIPEPWLVIQRASQLLAPGGILLLAMPNPESYEFSVMKSAWLHLDAPRHLHFFRLKTLENVCRANGLSPLEITTDDELSGILGKDAWYYWARSWIPVRYLRGAVASVVGPILYRSAYKKQKIEGCGSGYTAIFIKTEIQPR